MIELCHLVPQLASRRQRASLPRRIVEPFADSTARARCAIRAESSMFPIGDDNPTLRMPIVTLALLLALGVVWVLFQGAGFDEPVLAASVCNLGLVPGELSGLAEVGTALPLGHGLLCVVDREPVNVLTPLTSMFLHGSWAHLLGNGLFLWVFGNNIEDSMGRPRFLVFYLVCGLAAALAQVLVDPASPVPMVGASGAISGVLGGYLVLYPRVRVNILFILIIFIRVISLPAYLVLLWWIGLQLLSASTGVSTGVAVWAHIGGFAAGLVLVKFFEDPVLVAERSRLRHRLHPGHP
jgi:membrane associated rhomboid family serine protease